MKRISTQSGLTLTSFLIVLAVVGFFIYIGMKLFPVYTEYYSVVTDMKGLAAEPGIKQKSPEEVRNLLFRRFQISYVDSVLPQNVKISRKDGYQMQVAYEVRRNLMYNLDFVAVFDKTVELGARDVD
ncbi:MAG TPA: DUF4845 domain-containing protein [Chiayiivirga sp.]|jgi:hypothetical protein|uniref:DUF4845 domain-containing protein n=1 Tax=Denitratimonas tolerans TaxID=1338420 RepID=A0AAW9R354_9GAMM|nr:DUF4845 domain-containing protein [Xanthomonadaceae bacterium]MDX9764372.1 DUF4845 domain-containing protein [Chiayiivirga sp.]MEB2315818.1 DUF4845 domain-containing protein [Xanthomonadaceae bacterium]HMN34727.1 DUF4845 domain-containing protein [Chiayiivirga sp.]HRN59456.1 DUF4845 domain-containing protein [Chiayiivirga sp.]